ncbi:MAG: fatty-acyl-CoA synthase [Solirubrobacteraceae bacterium]|nr:fatty-acyl-CoA synthase [Solirubrobacteraceae bacterium]
MPSLSDVAHRAALEARSAAVLARAGLIAPALPQRHFAMGRAVARFGAFGCLLGAAAIRFGDQPALRDDRGMLTWHEVDRRTNAVANELARRGVRAGDGVAILARNHRGFLDAVFGAAKVGARVILLNTDFAGPQIRDVTEREGTRLLICDDEYYELVGDAHPELGTIRAWTDEPADGTLEDLIARGSAEPVGKPAEHAKIIILTSGTTGTPKGASRSEPKSLIQIAALLTKVPYRPRQTMALGAPMFHALGLTMMVLACSMGMTLLLQRKFSGEGFAEDLAQADNAVAVPVMMRRVLAAGPKPSSRLKIIFLGGSQLGAELCRDITAAYGPVVYNLYGSTEVAYATIATPAELAIEPGSVGSPPPGARVAILDEHGREVPTGTVGRIFVNNGFAFEGYTGGGSKEVIDGLMSSGDVGHFDHHGLLHVDGRDDEMIVSGAENVFPREVEELLAEMDGVDEAALVAVPDEEWGQRLAAYVVRTAGAGVDAEGVKAYVKKHLARYKVPRDVHFVDELPRNPTGKVLKRELTPALADG